MSLPDRQFSWPAPRGEPTDAVVAPRRRINMLLGLFAALLAIVWLRAVQLELTGGDAFRQWAASTVEESRELSAPRGRIVARDGTVLAEDSRLLGISVHFRYLEIPTDSRWLKSTARASLPRGRRSDPKRLTAAEAVLAARIERLHARLARLAGEDSAEWNRRRRRVTLRVHAMAEHVTRARRASVAPELAEHNAHHVLLAAATPAAAREIRESTAEFPGVRLVEHDVRRYPRGSLAAHLVGHLGGGSGSVGGKMGVERAYENRLAGSVGTEVLLLDRRGNVLSKRIARPPTAGEDVVLAIAPALQTHCEALLDAACRRRAKGGAIVVLDIDSGEVLAAASAPRFDPNDFALSDADSIAATLGSEGQPLFDRTCRMAIAPGSLFKTLVAVALLESKTATAHSTVECRGYLLDPDQHRCQLYRQYGEGHGQVDLAAALARSCNVYFFQHAEASGPAPIVDWARRFGLGRPTRIDLPSEAAGQIPSPVELRRQRGRAWQTTDTLGMAIGQGDVTMTPLQAARLMAAVASGKLVTPRVTRSTHSDSAASVAQPTPIPGLAETTLAHVRIGLRRVVADPNGTAFGLDDGLLVSVAGKTGTAQAGGDEDDHAWFAGYLPADRPRLAFAVALEHGGHSDESACPMARSLVECIQRLGMLENSPSEQAVAQQVK